MAVKLMYILNNDKQKYPFCRLLLVAEILDIELKKPTNQNSIKNAKVVKPTNKKTL